MTADFVEFEAVRIVHYCSIVVHYCNTVVGFVQLVAAGRHLIDRIVVDCFGRRVGQMDFEHRSCRSEPVDFVLVDDSIGCNTVERIVHKSWSLLEEESELSKSVDFWWEFMAI
jgi:predicted small secreted protein